jgi:hypothetical protein
MRRSTDAVSEFDGPGSTMMNHLEQFVHTRLLVEHLESFASLGGPRLKVWLFDLRYPYGLDFRWFLA